MKETRVGVGWYINRIGLIRLIFTHLAAKDGKGSPSEEPMLDPVSDGAAVSHGMGQEALLALLEARVTDLCAQLDNIDPALRDAIFLVRTKGLKDLKKIA